jgi:hypothetical protein
MLFFSDWYFALVTTLMVYLTRRVSQESSTSRLVLHASRGIYEFCRGLLERTMAGIVCLRQAKLVRLSSPLAPRVSQLPDKESGWNERCGKARGCPKVKKYRGIGS